MDSKMYPAWPHDWLPSNWCPGLQPSMKLGKRAISSWMGYWRDWSVVCDQTARWIHLIGNNPTPASICHHFSRSPRALFRLWRDRWSASLRPRQHPAQTYTPRKPNTFRSLVCRCSGFRTILSVYCSTKYCHAAPGRCVSSTNRVELNTFSIGSLHPHRLRHSNPRCVLRRCHIYFSPSPLHPFCLSDEPSDCECPTQPCKTFRGLLDVSKFCEIHDNREEAVSRFPTDSPSDSIRRARSGRLNWIVIWISFMPSISIRFDTRRM